MNPDMQEMKAERVRALAKKLGFKNALFVLQPEDGASFSLCIDTDSPKVFSLTIGAVVCDLMEKMMGPDNEE